MLYCALCLGVVWDGCPPPRRFISRVRVCAARVIDSLGGLVLGWDCAGDLIELVPVLSIGVVNLIVTVSGG